MVGLLLAAALQDPLDALRGPDGETAMRELVRRGEEVRVPLEAALPSLEEPARSRAEMVLALLDWQPRWPTYTVETPAGRLAETLMALERERIPIGVRTGGGALFREVPALSFHGVSASDLALALAETLGGQVVVGNDNSRLEVVLGGTVRPPMLVGPYAVRWVVARCREGNDFVSGRRRSASISVQVSLIDTDEHSCRRPEIEQLTLVASDGAVIRFPGDAPPPAGPSYSDAEPPPGEFWRMDYNHAGASAGVPDIPRDLARVDARGWVLFRSAPILGRDLLSVAEGTARDLAGGTFRIERSEQGLRLAGEGTGVPPHLHLETYRSIGHACVDPRPGAGGTWTFETPPLGPAQEVEVLVTAQPVDRRLYFEVRDVELRP